MQLILFENKLQTGVQPCECLRETPAAVFPNICCNALPFIHRGVFLAAVFTKWTKHKTLTNFERHSIHRLQMLLTLFRGRCFTSSLSIGRMPTYHKQSLAARMGPPYIHVPTVHPRCHFRNYLNNYNLRSQRFPYQHPSDGSASFWHFFSHLLSVLTSPAHLESSAVLSSSLSSITPVHVVTSSAFLIRHDIIDRTSSLLLESTFA